MKSFFRFCLCVFAVLFLDSCNVEFFNPFTDSSFQKIVSNPTQPVITGITSTSSNGAYGSGSVINVTVTFDEAVTLAGGSLEVTLNTGAVVSINPFGPATSASCEYTTSTGEAIGDLDSTAINLTGGTLRDTDNNDVTIALPSITIADGSNIVVDCVIPTLSTFSLTSGSPTSSHYISFNLNGSDSGTGITHWLVSESASVPAANDPGWVAVKPGTYKTGPDYGTKTVYAWAKDGASNVSNAGTSLAAVVQYIGSPGGTSFEKNTAGDDNIKGAVIDYDDNLYVVGNKQNATTDWSIIKLSPGMIEDTVLWNKQLDWYGGADCVQAAVVDSNNDLYVAGWLTNGGDERWGIKKYSSGGTELWSKEWNYGTGIDNAQAMTIDSNDNIYVGGYVTVGTTDYAWYLKKYHPDGSEDTTNWNFIYDYGTGYDTAVSMATDSLDNIYVTGRVLSASDGYDWMIRKYTANGGLVWSVQYNRSGESDQAYSIDIDAGDNIYVAGYTTNSGNIDWTIKKYDTAGNEITAGWNKIINYGTDDVPWGIDTDSSGNVWVGGRFNYADNEWVVKKFSPAGAELYSDVITPNTGADWCREVVVDSMNYAYGVGGLVRAGSGADWFIKRYAP